MNAIVLVKAAEICKIESMLAIAKNTFGEAVRQPAYGLLLIVVAALIIAAPLSGAHIYTLSFSERAGARSLAEMGLSTMLIAGWLLTVFSAAGIITREINTQTALTVLTKNVSRFAFVLGKFFGIAAAVTVAALTWLMLTMLTARFGSGAGSWLPFDYAAFFGTALAGTVALIIATWRNYFAGKNWTGTFSLSFFITLGIVFAGLFFVDAHGDLTLSGHTYDWQIAWAALLLLQAIWLFCGIATAAGISLSLTANLTLCATLFIGGLTMDYFYAHYGDYLLVGVARGIFPALQTFWMSEALKYEVDIPPRYVAECALYAALYLAATLGLAGFLFSRKEID